MVLSQHTQRLTSRSGKGRSAPLDPRHSAPMSEHRTAGGARRSPNRREPARHGIFLESLQGAASRRKSSESPGKTLWPDRTASWSLRWRRTSPISSASAHPARATGERSYYPALEGLLRAVGATLKPKVLCVQELAAVGAPAMADLGSSRRPRFLSDLDSCPTLKTNP